MDIEDLSKSQLLLLTVMVTFVTAIATAVLTVSLLDEAPQTVTQTVNRIVEHTIETVVPSEAPSITETVVINNEEFRTQAIAETVARTVSLSERTGGPELASGIFLSDSRAVATFLSAEPPRNVTVTFPDGSSERAELVGSQGGVTVYRFEAGAALPGAPAGTFVAQDAIEQGSTVIGITADGSAVVGIVAKVDATGIYTSLPATPLGSAAVNLDGDIVGIAGGLPGVYVNEGRVGAILAGTP